MLKETEGLINEIYKCFETINRNFKYKERNYIKQEDSNVFLKPVKLCQAIKESFEQLYMG